MAARRPPDARSVDVAGETADATGHDSCHSRRREEREGVRGRRKGKGKGVKGWEKGKGVEGKG